MEGVKSFFVPQDKISPVYGLDSIVPPSLVVTEDDYMLVHICF